MNASQFSTNCSNLTKDQFLSLNLAYSTTGAACCILSCTITLLLLLSKSYHSVLQRLFLYLMIATTARELFLAASIEHQWEYPGQEQVCTWIAYLYNWLGILRFVFTMGIMIYLFFLVHHMAKGNTVLKLLQSKNRRLTVEVLYIVLSPLLTFAYASVPYFKNNYGLAGAWCWIQAVDKDCQVTLSGLLDQLFNGYIFFISNGMFGIIFAIAVAIIYCKLPAILQDARTVLRKTFFVMVCFLLHVSVQVFGLSARITTATANHFHNYTLWLIFGVTHPISLMLFPIAFIFNFYPMNKLFPSPLSLRVLKCCKLRQGRQNARNKHHVQFQQQPTCCTYNVPTIPESSRVSPPSSTYFKVPYTNDFTHITTENTVLVQDGQSRDTGYGSVSQQ